MTTLIHCQHINKTYYRGTKPVPALRDISLEIQHGEYIAILGPSGSGKSTLMNILGCLETPTEGKYWLNGERVDHLSVQQLAHVRNQQVGFIFQQFHLLPYADIIDNVALPLVYRNIPTQNRRQQAEAVLKQVGLGDRLTHKPNELSGGECQRVAIARALVTEPNIILADEPTGSLDSQTGEEIMRLFEQLLTQQKTLILVTHDQELAQRTKRLIHIKDGMITQQ